MAAAEDKDQRKREAAERALELVTPGMKLGLGSGSTAHHFVDLVGEARRSGSRNPLCRDLRGDGRAGEGARHSARHSGRDSGARSDGRRRRRSRSQAQSHQGRRRGAVARKDRRLRLEAHGRHRRFDQARARLGAFPLPIEVVPFGLAATRRHIERAFAQLGLAGPIRLRGESSPFVTDGGHYILDCSLGAIAEPEALSRDLVADPRRRRTRAFHRPCARGDHCRRRGRRSSWRPELKSNRIPGVIDARPRRIPQGRLALFMFAA